MSKIKTTNPINSVNPVNPVNPINQITLDDLTLSLIDDPKNKKSKELNKVFEEFIKRGIKEEAVFEVDSQPIYLEDLIKSLISNLKMNPKKFRVGNPKGLSEIGLFLIDIGEIDYTIRTLQTLLGGIGLGNSKPEIPSIQFKVNKDLDYIDFNNLKGPISIPMKRKPKKSDKILSGLETLKILKAIGKQKSLAKLSFK